MNISLPVYLHPSLTVLIDDSQSFLNSLSFQLSGHSKVFHDTHSALVWIHEAYQDCQSQNQLIFVNYDEQFCSFEQRTVALKIDQIYQQAMNHRRFLLPSVLVIDYSMPQMNGLKFCQTIQHLPCKKILFTGQADEKIAIEAFNRGLIDRFIKKDDHYALEHLEREIGSLQKKFFHDQSLTLKELLTRHSYYFLSDPSIVALVEQLCQQYGFVEYYLFPNPTGILFFDLQGKPTLMVVETKASLLSHFEVAQDYGAPLALLTGLREHRLVPFFFTSGGMYTEVIGHEWLTYCLPAQICRGIENYYWALFDLPQHYLGETVYSFAQFLHDQLSSIRL